MDFFKTIGGKIVGGLVGLAVVIAAISWLQMDSATKHALVAGTGKIIAWLGVVLIVPWVSFSLIGWVNRKDSNAAGAALVAAYTVAEVILLLKLFGWSLPGTTAWVFFAVGGLLAAAYNLFACDWIAEKI